MAATKKAARRVTLRQVRDLLATLTLPGPVEIRAPLRSRSPLYASIEALEAARDARWCAARGLTAEQLDVRAKLATAAGGT